jgi:acyl-CoA synthetase (NDP forming)
MSDSRSAFFIDEIFHPKSIAVVGARSDESMESDGWVARLIDFGYSGKIYPVNPKATQIMGLKAYPTVRDIPEAVDLAIFNVPFRISDKIMADCAAKGVKVAHVYTAGFSETGKSEGIRLQNEMQRIAKQAGVRVIGPNCMGLYYPKGGITFGRLLSKKAGTVAFVTQSGASAIRVVALGNERGIFFSKVVSYGNAIDLDSTDFIEYLAADPETEVIAAYVEGVKDGRRYFNAIRECTKKKPLVALKAGVTEGGSRAAASHTAVLAGHDVVWDSFFKQTGVIRVVATDICEKAGLKVPQFHLETQNRLERLIPDAGTSAKNPVEPDSGLHAWAAFYKEGLKAVDADPNIDFILTHLGVDVYGGIGQRMSETLDVAIGILIELSKQLTKPIIIVLYAGGHIEKIAAVLDAQKRCLEAGLPVYPSVPSAAKAVSSYIGYHEFLDGIGA